MDGMSLKKRFAGDVLFNIIATAVPIAILQLAAYPIIGQKVSEEMYGLMVTLYALIQLISGTLGTGLNNIRLINDEKYKRNHLEGDFNVILVIYMLLVSIIMFFGTWYYQGSIDIISIILIISITLLCLLNSYIEVEYRLNLTFKKILITRIINAAGCFIGLLLFCVYPMWEFVFLFSQLACFVYNFKNTGQLREKICTTNLFKHTVKDCIYIDISGFCARAISYADKMLLLPIVGGAQVSVYYTATLLGKIVVMGLNPVNSVVLSYLNKRKSIRSKTFLLYVLIGIGICTVGYCACILISRPVLGILFPQWVDEAMHYVPITTLNVCIIALCDFLTPFTMKFCNMSWQFIINFTTMAIYISASLLLLGYYGLTGFCWGITLSYTVKLIFTLVVYAKAKKNDQ